MTSDGSQKQRSGAVPICRSYGFCTNPTTPIPMNASLSFPDNPLMLQDPFS